MKRIPLVLGVVVGLALLVGVAVAASTRFQEPFTIADLERTGTGLPNDIPPEFFLRARGLGLMAGQLRSAGLNITSAFRSRAVDDAVLAFNAEHNIPNLGVPGPGPHSECRGLDIGLSGKFSTPAALLAFVRTTLPGQLGSPIAESDHVHISFNAGDLEEVGAVFVASNPTFDLKGTESVLGTVDLSSVDLAGAQSVSK